MTILEPSAQSHAAFCQLKRRPNILYVDDNKFLIEMVQLFLGTAGLDCQCANSGKDALQLLTSGFDPVDILITDHNMPGMNGLEFIRKVRAMKFAGKIMVYSAMVSGLERAAYEDLKVDAIVHKTGDGAALIRMIGALQQEDQTLAGHHEAQAM